VARQGNDAVDGAYNPVHTLVHVDEKKDWSPLIALYELHADCKLLATLMVFDNEKWVVGPVPAATNHPMTNCA
jgi:hypothetical protein